MKTPRIPIRRPTWLNRPLAVLLGALVGLGALGGATGAVLGSVGSFTAAHEQGGHQHGGHEHGRGFDTRHDDGDTADTADTAGAPQAPPAPPVQPPR